MSEMVPFQALPRGFRFGGTHCGIKRSGRLDLGLIVANEACPAAGVFTTNRVKAAPVLLSQAHLKRSANRVRAIVVNSGNANCATGAAGLRASRKTARAAARLLGCRPEQILVCSTGVIGLPLPVHRIVSGLPDLESLIGNRPQTYMEFSKAILTTDTHPKWAASSCRIGGKLVRFIGCAKGAGMIHPQMATMLAFVLTDAKAPAALLQRALREIAVRTFNAVTVDGDTSTNDTLLVLASGASGAPAPTRAKNREYRAFIAALEEVCRTLALAIVTDGEGATRLVEIEVKGAASAKDAGQIATTIAHSPLIKTAVAGADPNWGRILAAAGRAGVPLDPNRVEIWFGGVRMYGRKNGVGSSQPLRFSEKAAHQRLLAKQVPILVDLKLGRGTARAWTCDLTAEYVHINASYRT
ncbi:MAG: bifunctional glutamate N-acetyltransferase/amino-acid acetyltransferase ArgJ [Candidatus Acidiferrales bacterium]